MTNFGFSTTGIQVVETLHDQVRGKTILITGASAKGLGAETALSLARGDPAQLILLARSLSKVQPVIDEIAKINSNIQSFFFAVELDKLSSVTAAGKQIQAKASITKIDIVINNAGIMGGPYRKSEDGIEAQFATNHIGHFALTKALQPLIAAAGKGARIVNVSSDGYKISPARLDDYNFSDGSTYDPWSGYGQSKTANILFSRYLAKGLANQGVLSFAIHPGVIFETSLSSTLDPAEFGRIPEIAERNTGSGFVMGNPKSSQQGVATTLVAALDPSLEDKSGSYLVDGNVEELRDYASSTENADKLWKLSEKLVGEEWDLSSWA